MARLGGGTTTDTTSTSNELYYAGEAFRLAYDVGAGTGSRREQTDFEDYVISATAIAVEVTGGDLTTAAPYGLCQVDSDVTNDTFTTKANCSGTWVSGKKPDGSTVGGVDAKVDLIPDGLLDVSTRNGECRITTTEAVDIIVDGVVTGTRNVTSSITLKQAALAQESLCLPLGLCEGTGATLDGQSTTQDECFSTIGGNVSGTDWQEYDWKPNEAKQEGKFYIYIPRTVLSDAGFTEAPQPGTPVYIAYSIDYTEDDPDGTLDAETRVIETDIIGFRWTPMFTI